MLYPGEILCYSQGILNTEVCDSLLCNRFHGTEDVVQDVYFCVSSKQIKYLDYSLSIGNVLAKKALFSFFFAFLKTISKRVG